MKIKTNKTEEPTMDGKISTIIGKDTTITGTIDVKGPLRIDGRIKGQVNCEDILTIGVGGDVEAEVHCKNAAISGKVKGNIFASEKVELQAKAEITGDLKTKSLVIEQGAVFCGSCNMKESISATNSYADAAEKARKEKSEVAK